MLCFPHTRSVWLWQKPATAGWDNRRKYYELWGEQGHSCPQSGEMQGHLGCGQLERTVSGMERDKGIKCGLRCVKGRASVQRGKMHSLSSCVLVPVPDSCITPSGHPTAGWR